ncbi:MAG: hypothetical protein ACRDHZ_15280, partial [Ktedonobacteraceae bacterium]
MAIRTLYRFNSLGFNCYRALLVQGQHDILGVLTSLKENSHTNGNMALSLIPLQAQPKERCIVFSGRGPEDLWPMEMLLCYDPISMDWAIAQLQNDEYLAMRTTSITPNGGIKLS